jgi:hypothetical protein
MASCKECGKEGNEKQIYMCSGCEELFCYNTGCDWLTHKKGLYICEACSPSESYAKFIIDSHNKKLRIERLEKSIEIGINYNQAIAILESEGFKPKYKIETGEKRIIKYGHDCGLYFIFDNNGLIINTGIWSGLHETDKGIGIGSPREDILKTYGENFSILSSGKYNETYYYEKDNLSFILAKTGNKREVVTGIILL